MKCFTVTEKGITPGIRMQATPYPHIPLGDPRASSADFRRVEIDAALAEAAKDQAIAACSIELAPKEGERRRSTYKLIPANSDDDQDVLVKFEANCAGNGGRTFYDFPRDTFAVAKGWVSQALGSPRVSYPVELVVMSKNDEAKVYKVDDIPNRAALAFSIVFDGAALKLKK